MENLVHQIVVSDFWTSERVLSRLYNSKREGSVIANKLFGEPLKILLALDEGNLLFARDKNTRKRYISLGYTVISVGFIGYFI